MPVPEWEVVYNFDIDSYMIRVRVEKPDGEMWEDQFPVPSHDHIRPEGPLDFDCRMRLLLTLHAMSDRLAAARGA